MLAIPGLTEVIVCEEWKYFDFPSVASRSCRNGIMLQQIEFGQKRLGNDVVNHVTMNIGQPEIASCIAIGKPFVIQSEKVEDGRVQVVKMDLVLDRIIAVVIRGTVLEARFDASTGHPHGKCFWVMVPSVGALGGRGPAELAAPKHKRVLE